MAEAGESSRPFVLPAIFDSICLQNLMRLRYSERRQRAAWLAL